MIKVYLKQAWTLMRQNRLFSSIYILGTGIAIALVMTVFIIYYIKMAPIYPEYNRPAMMAVKSVEMTQKTNPNSWNMDMGTSYRMVKDILPRIPHVTEATACFPFSQEEIMASSRGGKEEVKVSPMYADEGFWKVFSFNFLQGKPFTKAEVDASIPVVVVSDGLAKQLYATTAVVGQELTLNGLAYRICGVVKGTSNATPNSAADVYIPLWFSDYVQDSRDAQGLYGALYVYFLVDDASNKSAVKLAVERAAEQVNREDKEYNYDLGGQPEDVFLSSYRKFDLKADLWNDILNPVMFVLAALLFIPAFNLSGMISSRMDDRLCELGVRKAYGATNWQLLKQLLIENLLLTLVGCLIGLLLSYLVVYTSGDWILTLFDRFVMHTSERAVSISPEMLFNPLLFLVVCVICLLLNVVSAIVPALHALRHSIIYSLNTRR